MFSSQPHEPLLPFPALPEALKHRHSISELTLRPFGIYERDLSVDFNATPRPFLVTEIFDCCTRDAPGQPVGRDLFLELKVGTRIECLLRLVSGDSQSEILLAVRCPACGGELEIELTANEISELQQEATSGDEAIVLGDGRVRLRRPTGGDQLAWLGQRFESEADALRQMLSTLIVESAERRSFQKESEPQAGAAGLGEGITRAMDEQEIRSAVDEQEIGRAMDEYDPLVNFSVQVQCPDCGLEHVCDVDLEEFALNRLRQVQSRLLATVHRLARHYHWSEEEIFKVPYWRRDHYINLMVREQER
jgi:hypothetical protein